MSMYGDSEGTVTDSKSKTTQAGFDFARRLRKKEFTDFLKMSGWSSGDHVFMTHDEEPVIDVINRINLHATAGRAIIAIADPGEHHGFKLLIAERRRKRDFWRRRSERLELGHGASIGMLYSLLAPVGIYVPSQWTRELRFEKVEA